MKTMKNQKFVTEFTEDEYNYFTKVHWDGIQKVMTQDYYDLFAGEDFKNATVEKKSLCIKRPQTRDTTYASTYYDEITISKSCGILCRVSTTVHWLGEPYVKSHDVMGSLLSGPSRLGTPGTLIIGDDDSSPPDTTVYQTDGFGAVFQVPNSQTLSIAQTFTYTGSGIVYATYQHALSTISLAHAQEFNINIAGYGSVFAFYGNAYGVYDAGPGVFITV